MPRDLSDYIDANEKAKTGRKPGKLTISYSEDKIKLIETLAGVGASEEEIANHIGISPRSFRNHKKQVPEIQVALDKGKSLGNVNVKKAAYQMAVSQRHPNMTQFWLRSRCGWDDKAEHLEEIEINEPDNQEKSAKEKLEEMLDKVNKARDVTPIDLNEPD